MNLIFMLTCNDRTVPDCLEVLDTVLPLGVRHIGFKDVGVDAGTLRTLTRRIRDAGAVCYFEVVSETPEACLASTRTAVTLGVDRLLGGTDIAAVGKILDGSGIAYYPFAGFPVGHPTRLGGTPGDIAGHCRAFMASGAAGVDLLAYRATDANPLDLVRAARAGLGAGELIVAGSIDSPARLRLMADAGADGVTIGTALFQNTFAPGQQGVAAQLAAALQAVEATADMASAG